MNDPAPDDRDGLPGLFDELRQRHVPRVIVGYLVVAWAVIQVAETIFPYIGLGDQAITLVIALAGLGLPVAIVLAWAYRSTPSGIRREGEGTLSAASGATADARSDREEPETTASRRPGSRAFATLVLAALLVGGFALWHQADIDVQDHALNPNTVAVVPFRVAGASPELAYLEEGLVDLLSITMAGTMPQSLDPRAVLSTWSSVEDEVQPLAEAVEEVGRRLGTGRLILGEVVGSPDQLTLSARLVNTATGEERAEARVEGALGDLQRLAEQLAAQLVSRDRGAEEHRLSALAQTPLPALQEYLEGQTAYRSAEYEEALEHYLKALERDSTLALAALGAVQTLGWPSAATPQIAQRVRRIAWERRDQLSRRDRAYLQGILGPEYPAPSSGRQRIEAWENATGAAPSRPEAWYALGDAYAHLGAITATPDWSERARVAFARAVALDSTWMAPIGHLVDMAFLERDRGAVVRLSELYLARDSVGPFSELVQLQRAHVIGDSIAVRSRLERMLDEGGAFLVWIMSNMGGDYFLVPPHAGTAAVQAALETAASSEERMLAQRNRFRHALNRGWPDTATAALTAMRRLDPVSTEPDRSAIWAALYADGESGAAAAAAARLNRFVEGEQPTESATLDVWGRNLCAAGQWHIRSGQPELAADASDRLRGIRLDQGAEEFRLDEAWWRDELCASLLDALVAEAQGSNRNAQALTIRVWDLVTEGPPHPEFRRVVAYALVGLFERQGRHDLALDAVQLGSELPGNLFLYGSFLRARARLLERAGRSDAAADAWRRYLALRSTALDEDLERARAHLAALTRER